MTLRDVVTVSPEVFFWPTANPRRCASNVSSRA
jgi:hypothetical protein